MFHAPINVTVVSHRLYIISPSSLVLSVHSDRPLMVARGNYPRYNLGKYKRISLRLKFAFMTSYISKDCKNIFLFEPKMKLASNLTLVGLIAGAPSKDPATDPEKNDPVAALADHAFERQNQMRIQIQHWQLGVANSDEIAQRFIKETQARFFESYGFRQSGVSDWCIVRDYFENEKRMMRQESV